LTADDGSSSNSSAAIANATVLRARSSNPVRTGPSTTRKCGPPIAVLPTASAAPF